jgi:drug/metabolite transporter (DMT)-like permease
MYNKLRKYFVENPTNYKSEFILLFCSFVWGFSFPSVKIALDYASPNAFIFFRFFLTLIVFYLFYRKKIKQFSRKAVVQGFILGIFLFIGFLSQTVGLKFTSASNSAFITGTYLILIPFVQLTIIKIRPKIENIIGILIVIAGIYILSGIRSFGALNFGDLITLVCSVAFAFHIVYLDKFSKESDTLPLIYGQYLAMTVLSLFSLFFVEYLWLDQYKFELNSFLIFSTVFNGIFSTFIALFLAMKFQKYTTPVRAGLVYNMEQVFAVLFSFFMLSEILAMHQISGALLILAGLLFSEFYSEIKRRFSYGKN